MKLYGSGKSRSFRALWALEEAGIDYQYVAVQFGSKERNGSLCEDYRALNYQGKVPTLVDEDLVLTESGAILNYLAAKSAPIELVPNELKLRAKYDEMCCFILSDLEQGLWTNGKHRFALPQAYRVSAVLATTNFEFEKAMNALLRLFDGSGYLIGNQFSMADILLAHTLAWAEVFNFEVAAQLLDYKNRMYSRQACENALAVLQKSSG